MRLMVVLCLVACVRSPQSGGKCGAPAETEPRSYAIIPAQGYDRESLGAEIDTMREHIPMSQAAPSPATADALGTALKAHEMGRWLDAARGFRGVALDDTADKTSRQYAQYYLAIDFGRLKLLNEARALFRDIASTADHPKHDAAVVGLSTLDCP
jgi:hypothetical protein